MSDTRTLGDMITRIQRELRRDGLTADIRDSIATAVDYYKDQRFWFNEGEATAQMTVGTDVYALPTDYLELDELYIEDSAGEKYDLLQTTYEDIVRFETQTNSWPTHFTIYRDQLYVRPPTNQAFVMRMGYLKDIELSASATTTTSNAWTTDAEELIRCHAKADIFEHRLRNMTQADRMLFKARRAWERLKGRAINHAASGFVKKTPF